MWKNDDFHFRSTNVFIRFVRTSEIIEIYNSKVERIAQCSVRGIPVQYKQLVSLAQAALKKCLLARTPQLPNYSSILHLNEHMMPVYHPSSEYVDGAGWLIQIPGEHGQMTVELLSNKGERVRIVDKYVFTWNLDGIEQQSLPKNLSGLKDLGPQRTGYKAYLKNEIPDYVKWFIQRFR